MIKNKLSGKEHDRIDQPDDIARAWSITRELLQLAQARSTEIGAELLVVSVPAYTLVNSARYGSVPLTIRTNVEGQLAQISAELGIDYVDLLPQMRLADQSSTEPLYFPGDNHLSPAGNAAVAEILADILPAYLD